MSASLFILLCQGDHHCCKQKSINTTKCVSMHFICCSKLDEDNLYMAYADIMAKVRATDC